jgi:hypothetical protein
MSPFWVTFLVSQVGVLNSASICGTMVTSLNTRESTALIVGSYRGLFSPNTYSRPKSEFLRVVSAVFVSRNLLRLWQIESKEQWVWRASLEDSHTGERRGFANLDALLAFLREQTDPGTDSPRDKDATGV